MKTSRMLSVLSLSFLLAHSSLALEPPEGDAVSTAVKIAADADEGFVSLFNGKDLTGWETTGAWSVGQDGEVVLTPGKVRFRLIPDYRSFLWTKEEYSNFVLSLEFKVDPDARSGIFLRSSSLTRYMEIQLCDSHGKKEAMADDDCGALANLVAPAKNASKPAGEWNQMQIRCDGKDLAVHLNSELVLDLDLSEHAKTKELTAGRIGLQNQNKGVAFRNVRMKVLSDSTGKTAK